MLLLHCTVPRLLGAGLKELFPVYMGDFSTYCPSLLGTAHDLEGSAMRSPLGSHLLLQQDLNYDCC